MANEPTITEKLKILPNVKNHMRLERLARKLLAAHRKMKSKKKDAFDDFCKTSFTWLEEQEIEQCSG